MGARLRHDLNYLRTILTEAGALQGGPAPRDRALLSVLSDYLTWLAVDALEDEELARQLAPTLARLRDEMDEVAGELRRSRRSTEMPAYYKGVLSAMEEILSFRYGENLVNGGPISRDEFAEAWELTRKALNL